MSESNSLKIVIPDNNQEASLMPPPPPRNSVDIFLLLNDLFLLEENINNLISLNIDKHGIDIIKMFLEKAPDTFKDISLNINKVIEDGMLNTDDVPIIVNLIKDVMNFDKKKLTKELLNVENILIFIKTLIEILIAEQHIKVNNKEKVFQLIDISFTLLTSSIDTSESIIDCIKRLFKCG